MQVDGELPCGRDALVRRSRLSISCPLVATALIIAVVLIGVSVVGCSPPPPPNNPNGATNPPQPPEPPPPPPPPAYCVLCGVELEHDADLGHRPVVVMVDNHPHARPQVGLTEACFVFELLAEGGITRLMPVYVHGAPAEIGPVRSTRHYFLDLAAGLDALFAHCGQSPQSATDMRQLAVASLDEFRYETGYWRDRVRQAPHNLLTSLDRLRAVAEANRIATRRNDADDRWPYLISNGGAPTGDACQGVEVVWPYSAGRYVVGFHYHEPEDPEGLGAYERWINGAPHVDPDTSAPLQAANVVVVYARFWRIAGDPEARLGADLTGQGKALVFQQGVVHEAAWNKADRTAPLLLLDPEGQRLGLDAGQTWILLVPLETEVRLLLPEQ